MINIEWEGGGYMEMNTNDAMEATSWEEINIADCDESSLTDMCSWSEFN